MQCPDCGGPMWDNRQKKESGQYKPNRSDYSCKDKDGCGKGVWLDGGSGKHGVSGNGRSGAAAGGGPGVNGARVLRPLGPLYYSCMKIAKASLDELAPAVAVSGTLGQTTMKYSAAELAAATATLFIAATNSGAPLTTPKPKPKPAPPPPPPEPEPEEEPDYADERNLPFN